MRLSEDELRAERDRLRQEVSEIERRLAPLKERLRQLDQLFPVTFTEPSRSQSQFGTGKIG